MRSRTMRMARLAEGKAATANPSKTDGPLSYAPVVVSKLLLSKHSEAQMVSPRASGIRPTSAQAQNRMRAHRTGFPPVKPEIEAYGGT